MDQFHVLRIKKDTLVASQGSSSSEYAKAFKKKCQTTRVIVDATEVHIDQ